MINRNPLQARLMICTRREFLILLCAVFLFVGACAPSVVLHPIEDIDIMRVEQGESYEAPKDGYFLSEMYIKEVMKAKIR